MTRLDEALKKIEFQSINTKRMYRSEALFGSESAIEINHHGVIYTLRITQLGKLILTK